MWNKSNRTFSRFKSQNNEWFNSNFSYPENCLKKISIERQIESPEKLFEDKSLRSRRRDIAQLSDANDHCVENYLVILHYKYLAYLSRQQYLNMRIECKNKNADIWLRYDLVKAKCRPCGIEVSDIAAEVSL